MAFFRSFVKTLHDFKRGLSPNHIKENPVKKYLFLLAAPVMLLANQPKANDPFEAMQQMQREMDAAMAHFQEQVMNGQGGFTRLNSDMSKVDLETKGDQYVLSMDIPGASEKSIEIRTEKHVVTVTAKREEVRDENASNHSWQERRVSSYISSVAVPKDAETDHMKTDYKNGVLTITMPKKS